jgi:hypothetical protein
MARAYSVDRPAVKKPTAALRRAALALPAAETLS